MQQWKGCTENERKKQFSAVKVRIKIEAHNGAIPINQEHYSQLSLYSIHASPDTLPQAHGANAQAITLPVYQPAGFLLSLNEIALPVTFITLFSGMLIELPSEHKAIFQETARELASALGGVVVTQQGRPWFKLN